MELCEHAQQETAKTAQLPDSACVSDMRLLQRIAHCSPGHAAVTLQPRASKVDACKVQADKRLQSEGTGSLADERPACRRMWRCVMHC